MRKGKDAIDDRIGDKTLNALNLYIAYLNLDEKGAPGIVKVVGLTRQNALQYQNKLFVYYTQHPEKYLELLNNSNASLVLPYLSDEAIRELSVSTLENRLPEKAIYDLARKGLLGSRGDELLANVSAANVSDAINRFGANAYRLVDFVAGSGQNIAGEVAARMEGVPQEEWGNPGLAFTPRYNRLTGNTDMVLVPGEEPITVADALNIQNPVGATVTNMVTDPLFLLTNYQALSLPVRNLATSAIKTRGTFTAPSLNSSGLTELVYLGSRAGVYQGPVRLTTVSPRGRGEWVATKGGGRVRTSATRGKLKTQAVPAQTVPAYYPELESLVPVKPYVVISNPPMSYTEPDNYVMQSSANKAYFLYAPSYPKGRVVQVLNAPNDSVDYKGPYVAIPSALTTNVWRAYDPNSGYIPRFNNDFLEEILK